LASSPYYNSLAANANFSGARGTSFPSANVMSSLSFYSTLPTNGNVPFGLLFLEMSKRSRHAALAKAADRMGWEMTESRTKGHVIWSDSAWTASIFYHPLQVS
jgi:hypothetical protein